MKKKRLVFPDHMKKWIEARTTYKLTHAQIEMARELGLDPLKFAGIERHVHEHGNQSLAQFIVSEYTTRFGKSEPEDRRSVEQKLKAELAEKEQKRLNKAQSKAAAKWDALPEADKAAMLASLQCGYCRKPTTIMQYEYQLINGDLMLSGTCTECGHTVGRFVETA